MSDIFKCKKNWSKEKYSRKLKNHWARGNQHFKVKLSSEPKNFHPMNIPFVESDINLDEKTQKLSENAKFVSIAVPGSVLNNTQGSEMRAFLAGQIARASSIFRINEIVVFDDKCQGEQSTDWEACLELALILRYMECPQYLRKDLMPFHRSLRFAGVLPPLDSPHHLRVNEHLQYREGVIREETSSGSTVDIGLPEICLVKQSVSPGTRVTVKLKKTQPGSSPKGRVVHRSYPFVKDNLYWGYCVRIARSLTQVFKDCSFGGSYDLIIGTSDKGVPVSQISIQPFQKALIVFGGVQGLEAALGADPDPATEVVTELFHHYVNTCPDQGSRTIRTEEAIFITLANFSTILR